MLSATNMRPVALLAILYLLLLPSAKAATRGVVWVPDDDTVLLAQVQRAFSWPDSLTLLSRSTIAQHYPRSAQSSVLADREQRLERLLHQSQDAFVALRLDEADELLSQSASLFAQLSPVMGHESAFVRLYLCRGRVELARKNAKAAAQYFAMAAEAAVRVELDEAEYPPQVRAAFKTARERVLSRPSREVMITSQPTDAEVEVNGQLVGRTPVRAVLPPGHCFFSVTRAGFQPFQERCPTQDEPATISLSVAEREVLRDQLRERLSTDKAWFLESGVLESVAREENAQWVLVLERDAGQGLKTLVYSATEHAIKPLQPARYAPADIDQLSAAVKLLVSSSPPGLAKSNPWEANGPPAGPAATVQPTAWYAHWYVWAAAGVVVAAGTAGVIYWARQGGDTTVTFGARR